ncbi:hypothetical protein BGZ72_000127 [Mortierella alpina]|nr:hypothetical protein BGZ72_000127 [Mortierella alpina]
MDLKTIYICYIISGQSDEKVLEATLSDSVVGLQELIHSQNEDYFGSVLPEGLQLCWETPDCTKVLRSGMSLRKVFAEGIDHGHIRVHVPICISPIHNEA